MESFQQGLRDLGYVEGQNLVIEQRYAEGSDERLRDLAADLVQLQVEVIVAGGSAAIRAAQHATRTIPIVMALSADPVARGFVASLAHPGGNITGLSWLGTELSGKRLEVLKEAVPQVSRVAVLANPASPGYGPGRQNLTVTAQALGLHLQVVELRRADELDHAFVAMTQEGAEALFVLADALLIEGAPRSDCGPRRPAPAAHDVPLENIRGGWRTHVLWAAPSGPAAACRVLCGSHLEGCQAHRHASGAADDL